MVLECYSGRRPLVYTDRLEGLKLLAMPKGRFGDNTMEILLALAIYFAIWVLVIWGATYFNKLVV
jgi:hypothetical protein